MSGAPGRAAGSARRSGFVTAWLLALACACAQAQGPETPASPFPDVQRVIASGRLVVSMLAADIPSMVETGEDGTLTGLDVSLARRLAQGLSVEAELVRSASTFDDVVAQVSEGSADVGISLLSRTVQRMMRVHFSRAYLRQYATLLVNRTHAVRLGRGCPTFRQVTGDTATGASIGALAGSAYARLAVQSAQALQVAGPREFDDMDALVEAAVRGEIVASLQGEVLARHYLRRHPPAALHLRACGIPEIVDHVAIAVRPDAPNLLRFVDHWLANRRLSFEAAEVVSGAALERLEGLYSSTGELSR